jgi:hypothetical protein
MTPHHDACLGVPKSRPHWLDTYPVHLSRSWTLASREVLLLRGFERTYSSTHRWRSNEDDLR